MGERFLHLFPWQKSFQFKLKCDNFKSMLELLTLHITNYTYSTFEKSLMRKICTLGKNFNFYTDVKLL
jgi:hypothetical protein